MSKSVQDAPGVLLWIPPHRFAPRGIAELLLAILLCVLLFFFACDNGDEHGNDYLAVFEIEVADEEHFFLALDTPEQVELATERMSEGTVGVIHGVILRGDGGFNKPFDWHLDPATITFPDMAMELCDGRPEFVQEDVTYWVDTVGYYCPWGARIVRRVD
ncbi:MAG TPA: hypothetical protein VF190_02835 [Rhodothermales bacterium]